MSSFLFSECQFVWAKKRVLSTIIHRRFPPRLYPKRYAATISTIWAQILLDIILFFTGHLSFLLDVDPFYKTKWNSVTGQKYFSTGHLNSPPKKLIDTKMLFLVRSLFRHRYHLVRSQVRGCKVSRCLHSSRQIHWLDQKEHDLTTIIDRLLSY